MGEPLLGGEAGERRRVESGAHRLEADKSCDELRRRHPPRARTPCPGDGASSRARRRARQAASAHRSPAGAPSAGRPDVRVGEPREGADRGSSRAAAAASWSYRRRPTRKPAPFGPARHRRAAADGQVDSVHRAGLTNDAMRPVASIARGECVIIGFSRCSSRSFLWVSGRDSVRCRSSPGCSTAHCSICAGGGPPGELLHGGEDSRFVQRTVADGSCIPVTHPLRSGGVKDQPSHLFRFVDLDVMPCPGQ
jgi:hypothetical protein